MVQRVVILGGSFGGLHVTHALLKKRNKDLKVILVSKNSHFFWNIASVRAIVPGQIKDEDILRPIAPALARYPSSSYEFLIGEATGADFASNTVTIALKDGITSTVPYDHLVLATGANYDSEVPTPWKASNSYDEILSLLHSTATAASQANHITVAGAGATGVEVAGELAYEWGNTKQIVLLSGSSTVLGNDIAGPAAANELKKLNVTIKYNARAVSSKKLDSGKTEVTLENGETITTDLYLPTTGMSPNTSYIPAEYLLGNKTVDVDEFLRVKNTTNVWAVGDVVSKPRAGFMITQKQAASAAKNIELALQSKQPVPAKGLPVDILACAVGRGRGAGRMGSIKLPSFGVWLAKGKTLGMPMAAGYIDGSVA
ncbi:apoptosis-inducing factor B [Podospora australis]|uniref:Apoptosis-inducing factor B n=1 Tax=Podospora australis TaxID=1536484 RepID=A0AAN6X2K1_9PEZI|nr:apoptosis-inducing factor B [Podospora australis]